MASRVHIVISDRGWILERLAKEIYERLPYVSYDTGINPEADIQYYMTYGKFEGRVSPHEVAFFTHLEKEPTAAKRFFDTAANVDVGVAMSPATAALLTDKAKRVVTISPGVDLERYSPRLRIGVVGRAYHTGRKGEDLVSAVMDIPGIDWIFTGQGWPGPSQFVAEDDLAAFYRSLDYVLVPSRIEGGPMSVLEALACGVEVIASPVGWVPEFPHIEFKTGDAVDLRRVLLEIIDKREKLRRSVKDYTWEKWAEAHHSLFSSLLGDSSREELSSPKLACDLRAVVAVHGAETTKSAGGPSVRAPALARALINVGVEATFASDLAFDQEAADLVHVLNVWETQNCSMVIERARKAGKAVVLSTIYLDLTEHDIYSRVVPNIFKHGVNTSIVLAAYESVRLQMKRRQAEAFPSYEIWPGYYKAVRHLIEKVDHVILLSESERTSLRRIGVELSPDQTSVVHNPVVSTHFLDATPELFEKTYGLKDYVLMVGRIESRKNQLTLAFALRDTPYPLVFIGHNTDTGYLQLLQSVCGPDAHILGRLDPNSKLLASAFAGAKVFCLPSWAEGAPLAALEAAVVGSRMILSDRSSEHEYFGDHAWYCDPADPVSIRELVVRAYEEDRSEADRQALKDHVHAKYRWDLHTKATRVAYEAALASCAARLKAERQGRILIDLTTLAHRDGPPSGIARTEDRLATEMHNLDPERVRFIVWNSHFECFLPVSREILDSGSVKQLRGEDASSQLRNGGSRVTFDQMDFAPDDIVLVFGGAWIRNKRYLRDLLYLKRACDVKLVSTVYDVIQWKFQDWYPSGVGEEFENNCRSLITQSDYLLTCSAKSRDDIIEFSTQKGLPFAPVAVFQLGDDAESVDPDAVLQFSDIASAVGARPFVLYVSAVDARKNHRLLFDVWNELVDKHGVKCPKLILVGGKGWGAEEILATLQRSKKLIDHVHVLHHINDASLNWLYKNCLFTVYPSLYEGWGLPVAESIALGKICVASNAGSLPEVAPGSVDLLEPRDFREWFKRIEQYAMWPHMREAREKQVAGYRRRRWADTASSIMEKLDRVRRSDQLVELSLDDKISFAASVAPGQKFSTDMTVGGWGNSEKAGAWTVGSAAALCFRVKTNQPVAFAFLASAFMPQGTGAQIVDVSLNGVIVAVCRVEASKRWFEALLPLELLERDGRALLRLNIRNPRVPAAYKQPAVSNDGRALGVFVSSAALEPVTMLNWDEPVVFSGAERSSVLLYIHAAAHQPAYLVLTLECSASATIEVSENGQTITQLSVVTGTKTRIVHLRAENRDAAGRMLTVRTSNGMAKISGVVLYASLPSDLMQSLRVRKRDEMPIAHLPWQGRITPIPLGSAINVSSGSMIGLAGGWYNSEQDGTWSDGSPSSVFLSVPPVNSSHVTIELTISPHSMQFVAGEGFELNVLIGDSKPQKLRWQTPGGHAEVLHVPAAHAIDAQGMLRITLAGPGGVAPITFGSADSRHLSFQLERIVVHESESIVLAVGESVSLGEDSRVLLLSNWHLPEVDHTWSPGGVRTHLQLPQMPGAVADVRLQLDLAMFAPIISQNKGEIRFFIDKVEIAQIPIEDAQSVILQIPRAALEGDEQCILSIEAPEGIAPLDAGLGRDPRPLSFCIRSLCRLEDAAADVVSNDQG